MLKNKNKKRIALVSGGAGFIGSHMVDLLVEQDFFVRVIDNLSGGRESNLEQQKNNSNFILDTRDLRNLSANDSLLSDVEYVFHFAGKGDIVPSIEAPQDYMSVNIMGTVHLLEASRNAGIKKFIYAASSSCYGLAATPTREDHPIAPEYPYALSKYLGEESIFHWGKVYKLPVNSIRMFNVYGPRVKTTGVYGAVFGVFFKQKLEKKPFTLVGDGKQRRDFVYVTDVAKAFLKLAESSHRDEVYNLGAGNPQTINRLIELIGGGEIVYLPKRPGEPDCTWADISKISQHIGWKPEVSFEDGVAKMMERIEDWKDAPLWDKDSIQKATSKWFEALS